MGQTDDRAVDGDLKFVLFVEVGLEVDAAEDARLHPAQLEVERVHQAAAGGREVT